MLAHRVMGAEKSHHLPSASWKSGQASLRAAEAERRTSQLNGEPEKGRKFSSAFSLRAPTRPDEAPHAGEAVCVTESQTQMWISPERPVPDTAGMVSTRGTTDSQVDTKHEPPH